ncbi:arylesterase [Bowmanella sp. JS7-9]|uniref:Arylesterase n=1 Tax=Pseudobowmanella zhangzhouensis TaxID=1537679 RepID=A0ABW1XMK5_9ALTE|nr:arylesterase [Bowmanella sp. JS7-9]TBX22139.1 lysophospholipase [Bowmanella sp. JS7-9]
MKHLVWLLLIPLWVGSLQASAQATNASTNAAEHQQNDAQRLLILGDSLSAGYGIDPQQGWVTLLQNAWQDKNIQVINGAISGDTTAGGVSRLPALLQTHNPTHVLIELGGNDGLQGYPINEMRENLKLMIELVREHGAKPILQKMRIPTNYGKRYTQMFTDSYIGLATEHKVPLVPFFLDDIALDASLMQADGIHPKAQAQPQIMQFMRLQLENILIPAH